MGTATTIALPQIASYNPGQLVATPGLTPGDLAAVAPTRGTSNSTALMSRAAAFLIPVLDELRGLEGGQALDEAPDATWLKVLLVHSAQWAELGTAYQTLLRTPENAGKLSEYLTGLLGFGRVDVDTVRECTATRVTALACGNLAPDSGYEHRLPLPPSLSGKRGRRRLVVTLGWIAEFIP